MPHLFFSLSTRLKKSIINNVLRKLGLVGGFIVMTLLKTLPFTHVIVEVSHISLNRDADLSKALP
ncbi:MAG: hypothetical protein QXP80_03925 [Zestosphaera sp.]